MNDLYTKEKLFALDAESLIDRAFELKYIGGTYGSGITKPSKFICLLLKMLQMQPSDAIVLELIKNRDYRYIRALGVLYFRMTCHDAVKIYTTLEPLLADYRRLAMRQTDGKLVTLHMDEYVDMLLTEELFCGVSLPRLALRSGLVEQKLLQERKSALNIDEDEKPSRSSSRDSYKW